MPDANFNPLAVVQSLESAGVERTQAEAIANAINHVAECTATNADLKSSVASLRSEYVSMRWMVGTTVTLLLSMLGLFLSVLLGLFDKQL